MLLLVPFVFADDFDVQFTKGWNMISLPVESLSVSDFDVGLRNAGCYVYHTTFWGWDAERRSYFQPTILRSGEGYWAYAYSDCDFSISGTLSTFKQDISVGWNLIGAPVGNYSLEDLFEGCGDIVDYGWEYNTNINDHNASFYDSVLFNEILEPFNAYWVYSRGECYAHEPADINVKNPNFYSDKETFLVSGSDWHNVLPLVPLTVWTQQEEDESDCQRGYLTPENVCFYPTLTFSEETYEDKIIELDAEKILEDHYLDAVLIPKKIPIFEQEVNNKSFSVTFNISEELLSIVGDEGNDDWGTNHFTFIVEGIRPEPFSSNGEEREFETLFEDAINVNGVWEDMHNVDAWGTRFSIERQLRISSWEDYELKSVGNVIFFDGVDSDYIITSVKLYFGRDYLSKESGDDIADDWIYITNKGCDSSDLCITNLSINQTSITPGEKVSYSYVIENMRNVPVDLRETDTYRYVFKYGNYINKFISRFDYVDVEFGLLNPGDVFDSMSFTGKNMLAEDEAFDADSIIYFLQQYSPTELNLFGSTPQNLDDLLIAEQDFGAGLTEDKINVMSVSDYFNFWDNYNDVVYVEADYELALLASSYASLLNVPLVIENTVQDNSSYFVGVNVICVKNNNSVLNRSCTENYNLLTLQDKYFELTQTNKFILTNPSDLDISTNNFLTPKKSSNDLINLYQGNSLLSPFLASAKHELLLTSASTDAQVTNNNLKYDLAHFSPTPSAYFCEGGDDCSSGFNLESADLSFKENFLSFNLASESKSKDVGVRIDLNSYDFFIENGEFPVNLFVFNDGEENLSDVYVNIFVATERSYDPYLNKPSFNNKQIIASTLIEKLESGKFLEMFTGWVPENTGLFYIVAEVSSSGDVFVENDVVSESIQVRREGADLTGWWTGLRENIYVVNETNTLNAVVRNVGTEIANNVSVNAFVAYDYYNPVPVEDLGIVELGSIDVETFSYFSFNWTPLKKGMQFLALNISSSDDVELSNNLIMEYVEGMGFNPEFEGYFYSEKYSECVVGKENILYANLRNVGGSTAENVNYTFYYMQDDVKTVIEKGMLDDITSGYDERWNVNFIPQIEGNINIFLVVESSNAETFTYSQFFEVRPVGPDFDIYPVNYEVVGVVDEELEFFVNVYNYGTESSCVVNIYQIDYINGSEQVNLLDSSELDSFIDRKLVNFSFIPQEFGEMNLTLEVVAEDDINQKNNVYYHNVFILSENGPEMLVYGVDNFRNKDGLELFDVTIKNRGTLSSGDFNISFFIDNDFLNTSLISSINQRNKKVIRFEHGALVGTHEIKIVLNIDDVVEDNNIFYQPISFYEKGTVLLDFSDYDNNFTGNYMFGFNNGEADIQMFGNGGFYPLLGSRELELEFSDEFNVLMFHQQNIEGAEFIFYSIFVNSQFSDEMGGVVDRVSTNFVTDEFELVDIFVFDVDWDYEIVKMGLFSDSSNYNPDSLALLDLFYCTDWNFENVSCDVDWERTNSDIDFGNSIEVEAEVEYAEAFAIGNLISQPAQRVSLSQEQDGLPSPSSQLSQPLTSSLPFSHNVNAVKTRDLLENEIQVGYLNDLRVSYDVWINGLFFGCENSTTELDVYFDNEFVRKVAVDCYNLDDLTLSGGNIPESTRFDFTADLIGRSGEFELRFPDVKLLLNENGRILDISRSIKANGKYIGYDPIFDCDSFDDCEMTDLQNLHVDGYVADSTSTFSFSNVDVSQDYFIFTESVNENDYLMKVNGVDLELSTGWGAKNYYEIPSSLVQEEVIVQIDKARSYVDDYEASVYLIPKSDLYLTIFGSDDAIPQSEFMWRYTGGWGYDIKRALDPTLYADLYGNDLPDMAVGRIFGITNSDVSSFVARDVLYDKLVLTDNMKFMASSFDSSIADSDLRADALSDVGYNAVSVTSEEECANFEPSEWAEQSLISYDDHGSSTWAGIDSKDMPLLTSSIVIDNACSTCSYMHSNTVCAMVLRNGGLSHLGAVSVAFGGNNMYYGTTNDIYYNDLNQGIAFRNSFEYGKYKYQTSLIGDPTFDPYKPYLLEKDLPKWSRN